LFIIIIYIIAHGEDIVKGNRSV